MLYLRNLQTRPDHAYSFAAAAIVSIQIGINECGAA